jgi:hypothetical protein
MTFSLAGQQGAIRSIIAPNKQQIELKSFRISIIEKMALEKTEDKAFGAMVERIAPYDLTNAGNPKNSVR